MPHGQRLVLRLFIPVFAGMLILVASLGYWNHFRQIQTRDRQLETLTQVTAELVLHMLMERDDWAAAGLENDFCHAIPAVVNTRVTVIDGFGRVLCDSHATPAALDNHRDRPEFAAALRGEQGRSRRFDHILGEEVLFVALPVQIGKRIGGAARIAVPVSRMPAQAWRMHEVALWVGLVLILAGGIAQIITRRMMTPIKEMIAGVRRFAQRDLEYRLSLSADRDLKQLSEELNRMAARLAEEFHDVTQRRNELRGMLGGMVEGVLMVNREDQLLRCNESAARMFDLDISLAIGRSIQEVVRNAMLHRLIKKTQELNQPVEAELVLRNKEDRILIAHGTPVTDDTGVIIGALVVANDVTRLKKLERIRRDFVANVSHELKTPITAIQGFVETLRDGAIEDTENARRFLEIIRKHTSHLNAVIEDLLSLSRIEQDTSDSSIRLEVLPLREVITGAVAVCRSKAEDKEITLSIEVDADTRALINPVLMEQALTNLIDNAIKYNKHGGRVTVETGSGQEEVTISVSDTGFGITPDHLDRIFERFYRIDKGRSRAMGGTGLGLSIVKHIIQAHGGRVTVESTPGRGSRFTLHLRTG
ncbi:PAS domain-containing protein [bacterium]|nr:PAS domain-containing protein [candidate division CSSED10-310 bacterium]